MIFYRKQTVTKLNEVLLNIIMPLGFNRFELYCGQMTEVDIYLGPSGGQVFFLTGKSRVSRPEMAAWLRLSKWTLCLLLGVAT